MKGKKNIQIVSGKYCSKECRHCEYAVCNKDGTYTNCTLVNGNQNHKPFSSTYGLVIKPRKDGTCDYYGMGRSMAI